MAGNGDLCGRHAEVRTGTAETLVRLGGRFEGFLDDIASGKQETVRVLPIVNRAFLRDHRFGLSGFRKGFVILVGVVEGFFGKDSVFRKSDNLGGTLLRVIVVRIAVRNVDERIEGGHTRVVIRNEFVGDKILGLVT